MRRDFWYDSKGAGKIHGCRWTPEGEPRGICQIVHGIAEYVERYENFAEYLNSLGFLVIAEDHMGHGQSVNGGGIRGYFHGGWFTAVEDTHQLLKDTRAEYPQLPYVLFGHSMGSFMTRTLLITQPDSGISAAVLCGTGWLPDPALPVAEKILEKVCSKRDTTGPSPLLQKLMFKGYNRKVEHPRTAYDWLTRDNQVVDAYIANPLCGFIVSAGLVRDLLSGVQFIQKEKELEKMEKSLPVLFLAGGDDPVGSYGKGVRQAAEAFRKAGMTDVTEKIYPLCRHEVLNEINREEIFRDTAAWICEKTGV